MAAVDQVAASAKEKPTPGEAAAAPPPAKLPAADKGRQPDELQAQVSGMRKLLEELLARQQTAPVSPWYDYLVNNEVQPAVAEQLIQGLPAERSVMAQQTEVIRQVLLERVSTYFRSAGGIELVSGQVKKVALVGPTGVGKTTTLAKLAARFALEEGVSVALITADTYRIAAVDQLKTYADILNVPIEVVYTPQELALALAKHADKSLVLIDTAGRSQRNAEQMAELEDLLAVDDAIESYLVLSCTTRCLDAADIAARFSRCADERVIFTKLDESASLGLLLNLLHQFPRLKLSYLTTGQNVPDDIELVDAQKLAQQLLRAL